jgi:radical SAM superfamily enzyme YgiQ (UPF0313 family)
MGLKAVVINPATISETFWSMYHAMYALTKNHLGGPKFPFPPLGPLMAAGFLKKNPHYEAVDFIDRNIDPRPLTENRKVREADQVWVGYWSAEHEDFMKHVIPELTFLDKKVFLGGRGIDEKLLAKLPYESAIIGEADTVLPVMIDDIIAGRSKKVYRGGLSPPEKFLLPDYTFTNPRDYVSYSMQTERGCPFDCEYCNVHVDDGRLSRYATDEYVEANLEAIIATGFRSQVFVTDDNLTGYPKEGIRVTKAMNRVEEKLGVFLPKYSQMGTLIMNKPEKPDMVTDAEKTMIELRYCLWKAGFNKAFFGIETPNEAAIDEWNKGQNKKGSGSMEEKLQYFSEQTGMGAMTGGIFGSDKDSKETVRAFIDFFKRLPIPLEMIGLLTAPERTRLYNRLVKEGRLVEQSSINNSDGHKNFIPMLMSAKEEEGYYLQIMDELYSPEAYFDRVMGYLKSINPKPLGNKRPVFESAYSVVRILTGPHSRIYRQHFGEVHGLAKERFGFGSPRYLNTMAEYLTLCPEFTHFRKIIDVLKDDAKSKTYEPWQLKSWQEMQKDKFAVAK